MERYQTDVCGARTLAWSIAPAQRDQTFFVVARLHAVRRDDVVAFFGCSSSVSVARDDTTIDRETIRPPPAAESRNHPPPSGRRNRLH